MGPTPVYGARTEKSLQNADFAMKQTNTCRLSGDIITTKFCITPLQNGRERLTITAMPMSECDVSVQLQYSSATPSTVVSV